MTALNSNVGVVDVHELTRVTSQLSFVDSEVLMLAQSVSRQARQPDRAQISSSTATDDASPGSKVSPC